MDKVGFSRDNIPMALLHMPEKFGNSNLLSSFRAHHFESRFAVLIMNWDIFGVVTDVRHIQIARIISESASLTQWDLPENLWAMQRSCNNENKNYRTLHTKATEDRRARASNYGISLMRCFVAMGESLNLNRNGLHFLFKCAKWRVAVQERRNDRPESPTVRFEMLSIAEMFSYRSPLSHHLAPSVAAWRLRPSSEIVARGL
jgi:hypothetical protein